MAATREIDAKSQELIEKACAKAFAAKEVPGAVLLVGDKDGVIFKRAYGNKALEPEKVPMTEDTIFDMASCSKSMGCGTSIMILADQGKLSVKDKASKYLPGMNKPDKKDITIEQLLLHQGGFVGDNSLKDYVGSRENMLENVYKSKLKYDPGTDFTYSDMSFITLGAIVEAITGEGMDEFAKKNIFQPLKMNDTMYNPPESLYPRIAPTEKRDGKWIIGVVHDPRAYALGGVAGHAGLFSTVDDTARWCRMLLNKGELDGVRIMSAATVEAMTARHNNPKGEGGRGYSVDFGSPSKNSARGERFEPGKTFGHTGWTGTDYWIDPVNNVFIVLLTNRVHPDGTGDASHIRNACATIVAEALLGPKSDKAAQ